MIRLPRTARTILRKVRPASLNKVRIPQRSFPVPEVALRPIDGSIRYVLDRSPVDTLEAFRLNLSLVLEHLEKEGFEHFIASASWGERTVIGIPEAQAGALATTLPALGSDQPVYVSTSRPGNRGKTVLARAFNHSHLPTDPGSGLTIFTYYQDPATGRRFGEQYGCTIEIWAEEGSGLVRRPAPGGAAMSIDPESRENPVPLDAHGITANTYVPLDRPTMFDVAFPVDVVYMWVDGSDPEWRERRAARLAEFRGSTDGEGSPITYRNDTEPASRYRQHDELRYSLRSLERFAPWVRRVFLVTDGQRPRWLDEVDTNLQVVDHKEIMPEAALPTFNSHAITACLHRIPGLADHFLVINDDVLFGRPTPPERFFLSNGVTRFFLSRTPLPSHPSTVHDEARLHTCSLIETMTGMRPTHVFKHTPVAFSRALLEELAGEVSDKWERTVHQPFRSATDVIPEYLHHYVGYARKQTTAGQINYGYFGFGSDVGMRALKRYRKSAPVEVYCVNDLGSDDVNYQKDTQELVMFFEGELPEPSPYERPASRPS